MHYGSLKVTPVCTIVQTKLIKKKAGSDLKCPVALANQPKKTGLNIKQGVTTTRNSTRGMLNNNSLTFYWNAVCCIAPAMVTVILYLCRKQINQCQPMPEWRKFSTAWVTPASDKKKRLSPDSPIRLKRKLCS